MMMYKSQRKPKHVVGRFLLLVSLVAISTARAQGQVASTVTIYQEQNSERGSKTTNDSVTGRALQTTATLTFDLGNLPSSTAVTVTVTTVNTGEVSNFFSSTGIQTLSVPAESIIVRVNDDGSERTFSREASVDCSAGECSVGPFISELSVDLTGMPIGTDVVIYESGDTENSLRTAFNRGDGSSGGQPTSFTLLGGSYIVEIVDDGSAFQFAKRHTVTCADGGSCALNRTTLTDTLTMDLTGLPRTTDVAIFTPSDTTNALRFLSNQGDDSSGGQPKGYTLLQGEYVVSVIYNGVVTDAVASYNINCLGNDNENDNSCSLTTANLTAIMTIDLTGLPLLTDVRVFVQDGLVDPTTDNAGLVREFSNQGDDGIDGGQPKTFTLIPNTYVVEIVDDGSFDQRNRYNMTCLGGENDVCSLSGEDLIATLTIDFTGLPPTADLLIFSTQDTTTALRSISNQGGDDAQPRTYVLLKGEYIVEVVFDGSVDYSRKFEMSCFGTADDFCSLASSDLTATMTLDFTGLPSGTDLRIFTGLETMQLLQSFSNVGFGDQPKEYNLLQGNYTVEVIDDGSNAEYVRSFNMTCFGMESDVCSLSQNELSTTMSVDLTGLPFGTDFYVFSSTGDTTNPLRFFSNQGDSSADDQPKTFRVLHGDYTVVVQDEGNSFDYSRSFILTCRGMETDSCSVTASELSTSISIDLTGLPLSTDVQIFSALDPNSILRYYSNVGGSTEQPKVYTLLQGDYIVEVIDDGYDTTYTNTHNLTCQEPCSLISTNTSSTLTVDFTGLPDRTTISIYHTSEPTTILRTLSSQGDEVQPKTYTLLQGEYIVEVVDTSFNNWISNTFDMTCLNFEDDRCSIASSMLTDTLTVNLTGLPYRTNVVIYRAADSTTDAVRVHRSQGDSSDESIQPVSFTLLQGEYIVEIEDDGFDNTYKRSFNLTCFGGEVDLCSVASSTLTATMTIDLTGLPQSVDIYVYPASDTSAVLRSGRNVGGSGSGVTQPVSFTLLQGNYFVEIVDSNFNGASSQRSFNMTCFGNDDDFCSLSSSEVSTTMTVDLTGLPPGTHVLIYSASDTDNALRSMFGEGGEANGQPKTYTLLHGDYVVEIVDDGSSTEYVRRFEMQCFGKEDDFCSLSSSELSATLSVDLSGLPEGTDVRISLPSDRDMILRHGFNVGEGSEGGQPKLFTLLQGTYFVRVVDDGTSVEFWTGHMLQCLGEASDNCSLTSDDLVTELTIDLAGLPADADLEIYPEDKSGVLRRQFAVGGRQMSFAMLKANYRITVIDDGSQSDLRFDLGRNVQCLGQDDDTCAVTDEELVTELSVDLSGLPGSTDVFIYQSDLDDGYLRRYDDEGSGTRPVRTYVVLKANYRLVIRDDGYLHNVGYMVPRLLQCLGQSDDTCSVSNSEIVVDLSVDLTGQPDGTDVQIFEAGEEGKGAVRWIENEALGSQPRVYTVLKGDYTVYVVDGQSSDVKQVGPLDCTGGEDGSSNGECIVTSDEIGGGDTPFSRRRQSTSDGFSLLRPSWCWTVVGILVVAIISL